MEFPELKRKKQALTKEECEEVLKREKRGVLAVNGAGGYPYAMPMNHYYDPADGSVWFHCGKGEGHRWEALQKDERACFCVHDGGERMGEGWALTVKSVIVFGKIEVTEDPETVRRIGTALSLKFTSDRAYIEADMKKSGPATRLLRLVPEAMTGKRVEES